MKTYIVRIEEILGTKIPIKASSTEEAIELVKKQYFNCDIILDADDFESRSFKVLHKPLAHIKHQKDQI